MLLIKPFPAPAKYKNYKFNSFQAIGVCVNQKQLFVVYNYWSIIWVWGFFLPFLVNFIFFFNGQKEMVLLINTCSQCKRIQVPSHINMGGVFNILIFKLLFKFICLLEKALHKDFVITNWLFVYYCIVRSTQFYRFSATWGF